MTKTFIINNLNKLKISLSVGNKQWIAWQLAQRDNFVWNSINEINSNEVFDCFATAYEIIVGKAMDYNWIDLDISHDQLLQIVDAAIKVANNSVFQ